MTDKNVKDNIFEGLSGFLKKGFHAADKKFDEACDGTINAAKRTLEKGGDLASDVKNHAESKIGKGRISGAIIGLQIGGVIGMAGGVGGMVKGGLIGGAIGFASGQAIVDWWKSISNDNNDDKSDPAPPPPSSGPDAPTL